MNVRAESAVIIAEVMAGKSLAELLPSAIKRIPKPVDQALLQALCFGVCRRFFALTKILNQLLQKPFKEEENDIYALLFVGLYQILEMRVPTYAAVSETVEACVKLKKLWAKSLVNGILREFLRQEDNFIDDYQHDLSHPTWLMKMIARDWPEDVERIAIENIQHPPFVLRVNQQQISREDYLKVLNDKNIAATPLNFTTAGICLAEPQDVHLLPGFAEGWVSVQDGAAQLAAELLQVSPGLSVVDACAAPGGKTAHLLELEPGLKNLIAVDISADRLVRVKENLQRLKLQAEVVAADVADVARWSKGQTFDRILLDAPCSATGVIRRHPDILLLRQALDIKNFAHEQQRLLTALWPLLKMDGLLVYATCSILAAENSQVIKEFLFSSLDAAEVPIEAEWGVETEFGRQILPGMHGMDGFYYAVLRKCK